MDPEALSTLLLDVVRPAAERRREGAGGELAASDIVLERPKNRDHGDWASNIALKLAKGLGANPRELATEIADALTAAPGVASVEVAGPGFINIRLDAAAAGALAKVIVEAGAAFGTNESQHGNTINLEFVSANPTGPLHIGHTRWAALGDAVARLLLASGATLVREFYINDAGAQMERFGRSVLAAATGGEAPEDGYAGAYIDDLGRRVLAARPDIADLDADEAVIVARDLAYEYQLGEIQASLARFNVHFDVWFSERVLHAQPEDGV
ncbi:MAG TPA: arginine--tRNA ligase, partial [Microbacterium ginsengisoli]|nr:arginine--tRNA ligase [Microbacterium ginsengisoli]